MIKLKKLYFQRNGVHGNSFYTIYFSSTEKDFGDNMIATFETDESSNLIILQSCRIVNTDNPEIAYRGDDVGYELQKVINKKRPLEYGIYSLTENDKRIKELEEKNKYYDFIQHKP